MDLTGLSYGSKRLDHHGLVSGIYERFGLSKLVTDLLGSHPQEKLSLGDCLKAMVINGLGFTSRPLYLSSDFFSNKAVEQLICADVSAEDINAYRLGKFLDECYDYGLSLIHI